MDSEGSRIRRPQLIFFCELPAAQLASLFDRPDVLGMLQEQQATVSLALLDRSPERASVVRLLNRHRIPVVAWLLVPPAAGYWLNLQNYPHAMAAYSDFRSWAEREHLRFIGVGLDIQPPLLDLYAARIHPLHSLWDRVLRFRRHALFPAARSAYLDLVAYIRHDGYKVFAYQLPFIIDDRRSGTTVIQRMFEIVDLPVDQEVLMCFSSGISQLVCGSDLGGAVVRSYGIHADGLAVGSSGGGIILDPTTGTPIPPLSWSAFARDLRIAAQYSPDIHVFSLEGCAEQGWIDRFEDFDWGKKEHVPLVFILTVGTVRASLALLLWTSRVGLTLLGWLGWVVVAWLLLLYRPPRWLRRKHEQQRKTA